MKQDLEYKVAYDALSEATAEAAELQRADRRALKLARDEARVANTATKAQLEAEKQARVADERRHIEHTAKIQTEAEAKTRNETERARTEARAEGERAAAAIREELERIRALPRPQPVIVAPPSPQPKTPKIIRSIVRERDGNGLSLVVDHQVID